MSSLETALSAWLLFIAGQGAEIESQLLPPASRSQLIQFEEKIGYALPDDFTELYLIADGQRVPYGQQNDFTGTFAPLFGYYEFMPLKKALADYEQHLSWYEEELPDFFSADVRPGDPVAPVAWQPGWVPFAVANAANYAVDLSPPRGGTYGQVIEYGHDTVENRVMASSITEFMTLAREKLDPNEPYRYELEPATHTEHYRRSFSTLYFDMDWQQPPPIPEIAEDFQDTAMENWNDEHHAAVDACLAWLEGKGISGEKAEAFREWLFTPSINFDNPILAPPRPEGHGMTTVDDSPQHQLLELEIALRNPTNYVVEALPVSLEEAFTLVYEYLLHTGQWSQQRYDATVRIINRTRPARHSIDDDRATSRIFMTTVTRPGDGSLRVCNEPLTKSESEQDECFNIPAVDW